MFNRLVIVVLIALFFAAVVSVFILGGSSAQLRSFANARSICESAYAGACFNTGKAPVTWTMPTQNVNGTAVSCSELLNCSCAGLGRSGMHECWLA